MKDNIKKLLTRLEQAESIQIRQVNLIEKLSSENDLLSSTILKNELGEINEERRQLRQKVYDSKESEIRASSELKKYKTEYIGKHNELNERLQDVKEKQSKINDYITSEAVKMIKDEKEKLQVQYAKQHMEMARSLESNYREKEKALKKKISIRNSIIYFTVIYAVIFTVITFLWRLYI